MSQLNTTADRLYRFGKKNRLFVLTGRLAYFLLLFLCLWLSITLADSVFFFSEISRWGLFFVNIAVIIFLSYRLLYQPFSDWYNLDPAADLSSVAIAIGKNDLQVRDRLVNLYQLSREQPTPLLNAAVDQLASELADKSYVEKLVLKNFLPGLKLALPILFSSVILLSFMGNEIFNSTLRLINPSNSYAKLPDYSFITNPGNKDVLYNQPLQITTQYNGPLIENITLLLFNDSSETEPRIIPLDLNGSFYTTRLKNVTSSFFYQISAKTQSLEIEENLFSEKYKINVLIPPKIEELSLKVISPAYSKIKTEMNDLNDGNIAALKGSLAEIKITSSKVLNRSVLVFSDGDSTHIEHTGKVARGKFVIRQDKSYKILLQDTENLYNQDPISYNISVLPDNPPYVDISEPGQDIEAQLEDIIRIKIDAADDFGLSNVYLKYRYIKQYDSSDSVWHKLDIKEFKKGASRLELFSYFDFSKFYVGYNDQLEYCAVAVDNNSVAGFAASSSPLYRISFPSLDELFDEFNKHEEEKIDDIKDMVSESQDLKQKLEEINRELKRTEKMDWDLKKQIENSIEKQKNVQEKMEKIQKEIQEMVDKLDQNSLMNPELMEKYNELQNLFQEIAPPELKEAMQKLQQAMEKANPGDVEKALENFKLNQETFQANLERTLELFKQVQLEQQMDQLVQQAEKLAENQQKISEKLDENNVSPDEQKDLQNQQQQQQELLESLKRSLENMTHEQQLEKFPKAKEQLEETKTDIDQKKLSDESRQLQQQLAQEQKSQSAQKSKNLQKSFQDVQQQLASAKQDIQQQHKQDVQKKMLSAAKKMLQLSYEQEKVQQKTKDASQLNDDIRQMGREQANVQNNLSRLMSDIIALSRETFFLSPEMNKNLADAATNMQKSMDDLSERRNSQAANEQQKAMESLNKSIADMQNSMEQMAGAESGTGFEQFMEQLQQMAAAQGGVNGETLNLMEGQGNEGQMGINEQAQRQRLAAQQKAIREAMQKMNEDMGKRSDILGRLDEMGETMDEVIQDMLANNINRQTVERQREILSRMLDAQKSVREREFSKKRKAEQARKYLAIDPKEISGSEDLRLKKLQEALKKALSEGYNSEYQELINAYFKELSSQKTTSPGK
jgi:Domain of unknown function (DUF4175)